MHGLFSVYGDRIVDEWTVNRRQLKEADACSMLLGLA
jgi:hypothetical protein